MKSWYIVQSHSSFENKVAQLIKEEAEKAKVQEKIEEIVSHNETSLFPDTELRKDRAEYILIYIYLTCNN